jgi:hypothetical protein
MLLKDRIVAIAKYFFRKGILQINPTIFLVAIYFFMDLLFIIKLPCAQVFAIGTLVTLGS